MTPSIHIPDLPEIPAEGLWWGVEGARCECVGAHEQGRCAAAWPVMPGEAKFVPPVWAALADPCPTCWGGGIVASPWTPDDLAVETSRCPGCWGSGRPTVEVTTICATCNGDYIDGCRYCIKSCLSLGRVVLDGKWLPHSDGNLSHLLERVHPCIGTDDYGVPHLFVPNERPVPIALHGYTAPGGFAAHFTPIPQT